jgi:hypothetical protein
MGEPNRFVMYSWLSVFYRQAARHGDFLKQDLNERWRLLRREILDSTPKGALHTQAFDAVPLSLRPNLLSWLHDRDRGHVPGGSTQAARSPVS